ncbi:hypothetical protein [Arthrobacter sp. UYEF20]|uniref:hypothetical protein n=1 Tax=Arthrobacter sp. UYEF20 TaxID=1756363 RepID=UPI0033971234
MVKRIGRARKSVDHHQIVAVVRTPVIPGGGVDGLVDISRGGASVGFRAAVLPGGWRIQLGMPAAPRIGLEVARVWENAAGTQTAWLRAAEGGRRAYRALALRLSHTPPDALPGFPPGVPAAASLRRA